MPFPSSLRLDFEIARRGYRRYAAYPGATIAGVFTNVVFGFLRAYILLALFEQREVIGGYDAMATLTYVWLGQALFMTVFVWGWADLALRIRTGDIATDLVRPVAPLRAAFAFDMGRAGYHLIFRGIPPFLAGAAVFRLAIPPEPLVWVAFLVSVALAVAASFAFRVLYNLAAFWLLDHRGPSTLGAVLVNLFSGLLIPISFFPDWLAALARATPFPSMVQIPIDIFIGATSGPAILAALGTQLAWAIALVVVAQYVFSLGVRRLVVQGG